MELLSTYIPAGILFTPLLAFAVILFFGKWLDKVADKIAIGAMGIAFVLSAFLFAQASKQGPELQAHPLISAFTWIEVGSVKLPMGFLVDNLSSYMCCVVTGLATLVLIYSIFYMHG